MGKLKYSPLGREEKKIATEPSEAKADYYNMSVYDIRH